MKCLCSKLTAIYSNFDGRKYNGTIAFRLIGKQVEQEGILLLDEEYLFFKRTAYALLVRNFEINEEWAGAIEWGASTTDLTALDFFMRMSKYCGISNLT